MSNVTQGSAQPPTALPTPSTPVVASTPPTVSTTSPANNDSATPPSLATPSTPPPTTSAIPSTPPPATPSEGSPAVASSPPPSVPDTPPATPSNPSPPDTGTPSPPAGGSSGGGTSPSTKTEPTKTNSPPPPSSSSSSNSDSDSGGGVSTSVVIGAVVGGVVLLLLLTLFCVCRRRKTRRMGSNYGGPPLPLAVKDNMNGGRQSKTMYQHNAPPPSDESIRIKSPPAHASRPPLHPPLPTTFNSSGASGSNYSDGSMVGTPSPGMSLGFSKSTFTFEELSRATDGFSDANLLGQGGFGYVHRGMLPNGKEVAVKQLKAGSGQGDREFHAEIEIISRVHHKHLVSLVGYCITGEQRLLVYEFVPNYTMEFHLHGKNRPTMDFATRLKIALGSAKGLAYLHEDCHPKIIHRDIKAANILLDYKFEAKVADFGLAKFSADNDTHVSTRVMGTFGYLAPEYAASGKLTEKSDVFSFGVMLLELITGRRPVDKHNNFTEDSLVDWARPLLTRAMEDRIFDDIVDPQLQRNCNSNEMARMVASAASCVRHSARRRPRMSQIVRALEGDVNLDDLNDGVVPGHSTQYGSSMGSSDYDTGMYKEDMKRFRKVALASQEYSSEYSQATNEYGLNPSSTEIQTGEIRRNA